MIGECLQSPCQLHLLLGPKRNLDTDLVRKIPELTKVCHQHRLPCPETPDQDSRGLTGGRIAKVDQDIDCPQVAVEVLLRDISRDPHRVAQPHLLDQRLRLVLPMVLSDNQVSRVRHDPEQALKGPEDHRNPLRLRDKAERSNEEGLLG